MMKGPTSALKSRNVQTALLRWRVNGSPNTLPVRCSVIHAARIRHSGCLAHFIPDPESFAAELAVISGEEWVASRAEVQGNDFGTRDISLLLARQRYPELWMWVVTRHRHR